MSLPSAPLPSLPPRHALHLSSSSSSPSTTTSPEPVVRDDAAADMTLFSSFIAHSAPWAHNSGAMTPSRLRSLSPMPKNHVTRSISTPQLAKAAQSLSQAHAQQESDGINTIPDPRSATPQPTHSRRDSNDSHPDFSQEVSTLSTKLINAINHSTMLDDSLQQARHELEAAKEKLTLLEAQVREHENKVAKGLLVEKVVYDKMEKQLMSELKEERKRRAQAEAAKRKTDGEVEALTAALFEEANVVSLNCARHARVHG
jgi:Rab guanine nucleotide exchange factor SEC2